MTTTAAPASAPGAIEQRYFIVSADCHVAEPPDLWETRIDGRFRSRLPRIEVDASGQKWSVVEGHRPVRVRDLKLEGEDLERSKAGSRDPEERLRDHARDGIDAEVIYPNRGLAMWASPDPLMQAAMCRVWNDWAIELFRGYEQRMAPVAAVAPADVEGAVAEVQRAAKLGYRGVFLPVQPLGTAPPTERRPGYHLPQFEPLWTAIEETGMPISFHVGTGKDPRTASGNGGAVINYVVHALSTAIEPVVQLCASGVLERHPRLRFVTVEAGIGWLAWTLWAADEGYHKHHWAVSPRLPLLPSEYFKRQGWATFGDDPMGIDTMAYFGGAEKILWGNDYPHHEGTWPHSAEVIERTMGHLPIVDRRKVLGLNAAKLYGFNVPPELQSA
ncbi:MAG TPA: amidohydrolase family protein [Dehalococcoidia bacterium]|nr:amidohydrolase family protein [Dehalococcoidia bacterium]